jgi:predicted O-methyltransferase YrrM
MKHTLEHSKKITDIHQHLVTLHQLVTSIGAKTVIELGVNTGESTVALLEAVEVTDGQLYSVDIQLLPATKAMLESYGLTGRWSFTLQDDLEYVKTWPADKKADLIFVDTSHQYAHTKLEIESYEPILRPGGIMVFHDTVSCYDGVQKPINQFKKKNKDWKYENKTNCNGLGILRKPS